MGVARAFSSTRWRKEGGADVVASRDLTPLPRSLRPSRLLTRTLSSVTPPSSASTSGSTPSTSVRPLPPSLPHPTDSPSRRLRERFVPPRFSRSRSLLISIRSTVKQSYLDAIWTVIDWKTAEARYVGAGGAKL